MLFARVAVEVTRFCRALSETLSIACGSLLVQKARTAVSLETLIYIAHTATQD